MGGEFWVLLGIQWTNRWKLVLKMVKTHLLTLDPVTSFLKIHDLILKEKKAFRLLGVEVDKDGLFTRAQVKILAYKMAKKVLALEKIVSSNIPIKTGLLLLLYSNLLASIGSYPAPHIQNGSGIFKTLDENQSAVIRKLFSINKNVDDFSIRSTFGLIDTKTEASANRLLLIHRTASNENDTLTLQLLNVPLDPDDENSSEINRSQALLDYLGSYMNIQTFLNCPYETVKVHIYSLAGKAMEKGNKLIGINGTYRQQRFLKLKPRWGVEQHIREAPAHKISAYIEAMTSILDGAHDNSGCCFCASPFPNTPHLFLHCPNLQDERNTFLSRMEEKVPRAYMIFCNYAETQNQTKIDFLFGEAKRLCPFLEWTPLQALVIDFSFVIKEKIRRKLVLSKKG